MTAQAQIQIDLNSPEVQAEIERLAQLKAQLMCLQWVDDSGHDDLARADTLWEK